MTGIPILYETQEEAPDIINEDELDVEYVAINYDDNVQEEYEDKQGLNTIEENQEPVNEEGIYITEEEDNIEFYNTDMGKEWIRKCNEWNKWWN